MPAEQNCSLLRPQTFGTLKIAAHDTGHHQSGFESCLAVVQDYASILEHLIQRWELETLTGISAEAQKAQEYVCGLPPRIRRLAERTLMRKEKGKKHEVPFTWIYDRSINM